MAKEFKFRGKTIEDLKAMSIDEFSKLLISRTRRSIKRGFTEQEKILLDKVRKNPGKFHKTHVRNMIILPEMVGEEFGVYTGKEWFKLKIAPNMVGHKLGDFAIPVKRVNHSAPGIGASRGSKNVSVK